MMTAFFILVVVLGIVIGYEAGHYEGIRCSCPPKTPHFIKRLLGQG